MEYLDTKQDKNTIQDDIKNEDEMTITKFNNESCYTYLENENIIKK